MYMLPQKEKGPASPQGGQILLIVILIVIVSSTIGLSLASRSIVSLRTSTEEADSQKALAAAEAGIERAIQGNIAVADIVLSNNSTYSTQVTPAQNDNFLLSNGDLIPKDEGVDVWFADHNADGTINYATVKSPSFFYLYWGAAAETCDTSNEPAAIQVITVSKSLTGTIKTYRYGYDSCISRGNNFTVPDAGPPPLNGMTFKYRTPHGNQYDLARDKDIVFMRVIPLYKDTVIGVGACNPTDGLNCAGLPNQGYVVDSTGVSGSATHKLTFFNGYPQIYLPYISYGLFVPSN